MTGVNIYTELQDTISVFYANFYGEEKPPDILKGQGYPATSKLLNIIPEETVSLILAIYRILSIDSTSIRKKRIDFPKKDVRKLYKSLQVLQKKGWLTQQSVERIKEQLAYSEEGSKFVFLNLFRKATASLTGGRPIHDPAYNLLVVLLIDMLKANTNKPHYKLITDFLCEQEIKVLVAEDDIKVLAEDDIKQCYKRSINRKQLLDLLKQQANIFKLKIDLPVQSIEIEDIPEERRPYVKRIESLPLSIRKEFLALFEGELKGN